MAGQVQLQPLPMLIFSAILSIFWTCVCLPGLLFGMARGPWAYFSSPKKRQAPQCLLDNSLGVHGYAQLSEVKLHYVIAGPENAPLMVFVHGFPEFWFSWRHQIKEFSKDYRTVAVDMRGYSESTHPDKVEDYIVEKIAEDIYELIKMLGHEKCTLVSHDWGGVIAQAMAYLHPDLAENFIIMNAPHSKGFQNYLRSNPSQLLMSWYMFFFQMPYIPELVLQARDMYFLEEVFSRVVEGGSKPCTPEEIEAYKYAHSQGGIRGGINYYRAAQRYNPTVKMSAQLPGPKSVLFIWGEQDMALKKGLALESAKFFPNCQLKFIENSGHWVQQEQPQKVNTFMREYLAK